MKKIFFLTMTLALSACASLTRPSAPMGTANPSPLPQVNLQATAAAMAAQTIAAMPTPTLAPSATPMPPTETPAPTETATEPPTPEETLTETPNPAIETLTATLGTGTPFTITAPAGATTTATSATTAAATNVPNAASPTVTQEATYPQTYGTMPPNLPSGKVSVYNSAPKEAYISIQCETSEGYSSIVEFPLGSKGKHSVKAPAGWCHAVVWVDGKTFSVGFKLTVGGNVGLNVSKKGVTAK